MGAKYTRCYNDGSTSEGMTREQAEAELLEEIKDTYRNKTFGRIEDEDCVEVPVVISARLSLGEDDGLPLEEPEDEGPEPFCPSCLGSPGPQGCAACGEGFPDDAQEYIVEPGMVDAGEYTYAVCDLDGHIVAVARTDAEAQIVADALTERRAEQAVELLRGRVNLPLLIEQKGTLVNLSMLGVLQGDEQKHVDGLVHLLDWLQDRLERDQ